LTLWISVELRVGNQTRANEQWNLYRTVDDPIEWLILRASQRVVYNTDAYIVTSVYICDDTVLL